MGFTENDVPDQSGRTAVVTGANSGLGFHTSRVLSARGATVLMACRDEQRGADALARAAARGPVRRTLHLVRLDLADLSSVRDAAQEVSARAPRLDLLVNNAGVMAIPRRETADGFEMQLGTNHLGHFALTGLLLEPLLAAPAARVVSVSSSAHKFGEIKFDDLQSERSYGRWKAYGQSKLANLLFMTELQRRFAAAQSGAVALAAHPGFAATNLQSGPAQGVPLVGPLVAGVMKVVNLVVAQSDAHGAWPVLQAATDPDAVGGDYYGPQGPAEARGESGRAATTQDARDPETAAALWEASADLTGVRYEALGETAAA